MGELASFPVRLASLTCFSCGVEFAMPERLKQTLIDHHDRNFFCPNGHEQHFIGKTEAEKLSEELTRTKATLEQTRKLEAEQQRRAHAAEEKLIKANHKLKRTRGGVCPCCRRSFTALRRHMDTKHPEWKP